MKKSLVLLIIGIIVFTSTGKSQGPNLDEVLSSYYNAIGIEKMKDWQTMTSTGKTVFGGQEYPFSTIVKRPGKIRVEAEVQRMKMVQSFDGEKGWSIIPWTGSTEPQDMTADQVKGMKNNADLDGSLYHWKEKGHKAELLGKEDMEGSIVYKIKVARADGDVETYFIDADNYVILKMASTTKIQGNETESEIYFSNYKEIQGVMMPTAITTKMKEQTVSQVIIDKVEINTPVNDSIFMKPIKK